MKKSRIVLRSIFLILIAAVVVFFSFGLSNFSYAEKELSYKEENLAAKAKLVTGKGEKTVNCLIDGNYKTVWSPKDRQAGVIFNFDSKITFNTLVIREKGWNVKDFDLYYSLGEDTEGNLKWERFYRGDKIEDFRVCAVENITTDKIKIMVNKSNAKFKLSEIEIYNVEPVEQNFTSCGYIVTDRCVKYADAKPGERGYLDPVTFKNMKRVTIIGDAVLNPLTGEIELKKIPGTDTTYFEFTYNFLKKCIGNNDVEIFVTGFTKGGDFLKKSMRTKAIKNSLDFILKYDLAGFDIDWEFPTTQAEFDMLSDFIVEMHEAFEPHGKKLSTAWYPWDVTLKAEAYKAMDYLNIMAYDQFDQDGNICSFMSGAVQPVEYFLNMGIEPEKLYLGLPLYAQRYINGELKTRIVDGQDISLSRFNGESYGFMFNSPQLIADKTAYAIEEGLGGVFVFSLHSDAQRGSQGCMTEMIENTMNQRLVKESEGEKK